MLSTILFALSHREKRKGTPLVGLWLFILTSTHTFRHWKATTEYAKTKDILRVMKMLGHKSIQNTLLYTQLVNFENDEFYSANAKTVEETQKLIEAGFEYVCNFEEIKLFRKRK